MAFAGMQCGKHKRMSSKAVVDAADNFLADIY
jgi:hypothetical protein